MNLEITKSGRPAMWVGGGAATNTGGAFVVLDKDFNLKTALFIRRKGNLSNSREQALVPVEVGDFLVSLSHRRDTSEAAFEAGELEITAEKIVEIIIDKGTYRSEPAELVYSNIPERALVGSNSYHNRDGEYFTIAE